MNIVFFGSSQFAVPSLEALLTTAHKVSCVITQPDRPKGRGLNFEVTAVKKIATESGLMVYQPERANTSRVTDYLKALNPELFVVISYGQILSRDLLNIPKIMAINTHASILPRYRGAAPINWAIIKGETVTGVTIIKMLEKMDAGPVILQEGINIATDDTAITLENKLSHIASRLLLSSIKSIEDKNYKLTPQDEVKISFAPKLKKQDGLINWESPACEIENLVRGCLNWPGAFTYYNGKLLKIYKAKVFPLRTIVGASPGEIIEITKDGILVATGKDVFSIEELQLEGKRIMTAEEFIAGHKIKAGEILKRI